MNGAPELRTDPFLDLLRDAEGESAAPSGLAARLNRRSFLKVSGLAGGGLMLAFWLDERSGPWAAELPPVKEGEFAPNAFLRVAGDGNIVIYSKSPEIGQGIKTAFPMIVAEELDARWSDVRVEQAPINPEVYGRQSAGGSRSIPTAWNQLRQAGAVARAMLVAAAADTWGAPREECSTADSAVVHRPSGRKLGYGELAERAAAMPVPDPASVPLKAREDYKLLGTRVGGVDNRDIVTGAPLFGIDQALPGMLYATYQKCPATGGRVSSANLEEIKELPGVEDAFVVEGNDTVTELMPGVAIVAGSTWHAFEAKRKLRIEWDESEASKDSWSAAMQRASELAREPGDSTIVESGSVDSALGEAASTVQAFYSYPFLSHAPLEPQNCTAWYRDGSIEIWAPTQTPERALANVSSTLGLAREQITLHQTRVGGGFGRRLRNDYVCEAAAIARRVDAPVKLQWTREDDMKHDFYRVGGFHAFTGGVDSAGKLSAWQDHFITFSGDGKSPVSGGDLGRSEFPSPLVPNFRASQTMLPLRVPCGPWRAPRSNGIAFAVQCFLNELAVAAGRDHLEFLLDVMGEPRWLEQGNPYALNTGRAAAVIKLAAEKASWGASRPRGTGLGLAFHFSHAGHFAEVAEVSVTSAKKLTVHKVVVAGDIGPIVNLSGAENQVQGAVIDGFSTMLGLAVSIEHGRVQESNFDRYPILRMGKAPEVEVHFIQSDFPPTGLGEPALPPAAPAVCNAIFAATGERVRTLPLTRSGFSV
jgi:isoquinoline 1-oxidoreductase beta subunit